MLAQKDESDANHRLEITRLQEQERRLGQDFARAQEQNKTLIEDNRSLASELVMYQEDAKAMSETLVIKDAEVSSLVRAQVAYLALSQTSNVRYICKSFFSA